MVTTAVLGPAAEARMTTATAAEMLTAAPQVRTLVSQSAGRRPAPARAVPCALAVAPASRAPPVAPARAPSMS